MENRRGTMLAIDVIIAELKQWCKPVPDPKENAQVDDFCKWTNKLTLSFLVHWKRLEDVINGKTEWWTRNY